MYTQSGWLYQSVRLRKLMTETPVQPRICATQKVAELSLSIKRPMLCASIRGTFYRSPDIKRNIGVAGTALAVVGVYKQAIRAVLLRRLQSDFATVRASN